MANRGVFWLVLAFAGALYPPAAGAMAGDAPDYLRIVVSPQVTVYVQFHENEMRLSTTLDGLGTAKPFRATAATPADRAGSRFAQFPEIPLPVPADALPAPATKLTATFRHIVPAPDGATSVVGGMKFLWNDESGRKWAYLQRVNLQTGATADVAPAVRAANLKKMSLDVAAKTRGDVVGVAVRLIAGNQELCDVQRDGRSVSVKMQILDDQRKEVASKDGPLADYGFG